LGRVYLLRRGFAFAAEALDELADAAGYAEIGFLVEQVRVVHGLVGEEEADRGEDIGGHPHAADGAEDALLDEFFPEIVQEEEDHEEDDGEDEGEADSAFADDRAEGGADEEHNEDCDGERDLLVPGYLVLAEIIDLILI